MYHPKQVTGYLIAVLQGFDRGQIQTPLPVKDCWLPVRHDIMPLLRPGSGNNSSKQNSRQHNNVPRHRWGVLRNTHPTPVYSIHQYPKHIQVVAKGTRFHWRRCWVCDVHSKYGINLASVVCYYDILHGRLCRYRLHHANHFGSKDRTAFNLEEPSVDTVWLHCCQDLVD